MREKLSIEHLNPEHRASLQRRFDDVVVLHDHSWGDTDTAVLELEADGQHCIVKTFGPANHHFEREAHAHREFTTPLLATDTAPRVLHIDDQARLLVTAFLPGQLVEGHDAEWEAETYQQAGRLLARLHGQARQSDPDLLSKSLDRTRQWLEQDHRIEPDTEERLHAALDSIGPAPVEVVPTHGDWQPRNWLVDQGRVLVIDFGRAGWRPPAADFTRLAVQQFRRRPDLAEAFTDGYGSDPRCGEVWKHWQLFEAIGTSVYAFGIGAEEFEAQGHRMITGALRAYKR